MFIAGPHGKKKGEVKGTVAFCRDGYVLTRVRFNSRIERQLAMIKMRLKTGRTHREMYLKRYYFILMLDED